MDYKWSEFWDYVRSTATSHEQWSEIAVIADLSVADVRQAIVQEKGLANIDRIAYGLGFKVGSGGSRTIQRFAAEKAVLAHALQRFAMK